MNAILKYMTFRDTSILMRL